MFKISTEEKSLHFIYLLVFWAAMSCLFYFAIFHSYTLPEIRSKQLVLNQLDRQKNILKEHAGYVKHIDSLHLMLLQYNPSTNQAYLESTINYELEELGKIYEAKEGDLNYKLFLQLQEFYSMIYFDKKAAWNHQYNTDFLKKNLQECEIGFQQKLNNLNIKEAIKNSQP